MSHIPPHRLRFDDFPIAVCCGQQNVPFFYFSHLAKKKKKNTRKRKPKIPFIVLAQKLRGRERTGCLVNEKVSGLEI